MKLLKITFFVILVLCFSQVSQAQLFFGVKGGLAASQFTDQEEAASNIVAGATIGTDIMPMLDLGIEYEMLISPFKFEYAFGGEDYTTEISQSMIGVYGKLYPLPVSIEIVDPYIRAGAGYYMGKIKDGLLGEADFKKTMGFNVGIGTDTIIGLSVEAVLHLVDREVDSDDPLFSNIVAEKMNYLTVMVCYIF